MSTHWYSLTSAAPNGAGKTTMFNIITGAYKPSKGEIKFDGVILNSIKPNKIVNLGIARTFQNIRLFGSLSVVENVLIGLNQSTKYSFLEACFHLGRFAKAEKLAKNRAMAILEHERTEYGNHHMRIQIFRHDVQ